MEFIKTDKEKQSLMGALLSIAKSLEIIAENTKTTPPTGKYAVIRSYSFDKAVELVQRLSYKKTQTVFDTAEEAKKLMEDDLIAHFNSNGWEDDIVPDIETIKDRGYGVEETDTSLSLSSTEPAYDADTIYWTIIKL